MQPEERKRKGVLGIRLSHLSRQPEVRRHIRDEVAAGKDLIEIVKKMVIGEQEIKLVEDEREMFAGHLDTLIAGTGSSYLADVGDKDTSDNRNHDWDWWMKGFRDIPGLRAQLDTAVGTVLGFDQDVDVSGLFKDNTTAVLSKDSGYTELIFQVPEEVWANKGLD